MKMIIETKRVQAEAAITWIAEGGKVGKTTLRLRRKILAYARWEIK